MPQVKIKAPDGNTYTVNAPDGASNEQILGFVKQEYDAGRLQSSSKASGEPKDGKGSDSTANKDKAVTEAPTSSESYSLDQLGTDVAGAGRAIGSGLINLVNAPANLVNMVTGENTVYKIPTPEVLKPRGKYEEIGSEIVPYLVGGVPATAAKAGQVAANAVPKFAKGATEAVTRNAVASVPGAVANADSLNDVAVDTALGGVAGGATEGVLKTIGKVVAPGKESRRAVISKNLQAEKEAKAAILEKEASLQRITSYNNDLESGLNFIKGGSREAPRTFGEIRDLVKDKGNIPAPYNDKGRIVDNNYISNIGKTADDYVRALSDGNYGLRDMPEELAAMYPNKEMTAVVERNIINEARPYYDVVANSKVGAVSDINQAIKSDAGPLGGTLTRPSVSIGNIPYGELRSQFGLSPLEAGVAKVGAFMENTLPLDAGNLLRTASNNSVAKKMADRKAIATRQMDNLETLYRNNLSKEVGKGEAVSGKTGSYFLKQKDAWEAAQSGRPVNELSDSELKNFMTTSAQTRINSPTNETPTKLTQEFRSVNEVVNPQVTGKGSLIGLGATALTGGSNLLAQVPGALINRNISRSVASDISRVKGTRGEFGKKLDELRSGVGKVADVVAEPVSQVARANALADEDKGRDEDMSRERLVALDDWADKNGISEETMARAVQMKGSDLSNLTGINSVKRLATEIHNAELVKSGDKPSEGYDPAFVVSANAIEDAMAEAMHGLSPEEQEWVIDEYMDAVHGDEDKALKGLVLQDAIARAVKHALAAEERILKQRGN